MFRKKMIFVVLAVVMSLGKFCTNVLACGDGVYGWGRYTGESVYRYEVDGFYYGEDVTRENDYFTPDTYVCPDSGYRFLTERELRNFSGMYLMLARNEIYARYGYDFGRPALIRYFGGKTWYHKTPYFCENYLNMYEAYNIKLICAEEARRGGAVSLVWND